MFLLGLFCAALGVGIPINASRPSPMVIDESGLHLRVAGIKQMLPWTAVDALILEPGQGSTNNEPPRLILVPAAGANLGVPVKYANRVDGRPSVILLSLGSVKVSVDELKQTLARCAGARFIDGTAQAAPAA
jgi:hypothetical protein